jgi:hypothetical protein
MNPEKDDIQKSQVLHSLTYDLWKELIDDVIEAHDPLFMAMQSAAVGLSLSKALVDELKRDGSKEIAEDSWHFLLELEPIADQIEGFRILLSAAEDLLAFEQIVAEASAAREISPHDIEGFELEHGLDLKQDIFEEIEDIYDISAEIIESGIFFELVIFDSQDIDNSRESDEVWEDEVSTGDWEAAEYNSGQGNGAGQLNFKKL